MRNLKKFLALVLAMMMAFSMMITVNASSDMDAAFESAYDALYSYGVFNGYGTADNKALDKPFTRAQMAAVAYRIATGDVEGEQVELYAKYATETFYDVEEDDWYAGYVGFCANGGIVVGDGKGYFNPTTNVTGMQAACMLLRLLGYDANGEFQGKNWAVNVATEARRLGITTGLTDASLSSVATRGVAAYIAYRGATIPNQVVYALGNIYVSRYDGTPIGYTGPLTDWWPLIWELKTAGTPDTTVWGDPTRSDTVYVYFNWPVNSVRHTVGTETIEPLYKFYDTMTECDLFDAIDPDGDGNHWAITYTNGVGNEDLNAYHNYSAATNYNTREGVTLKIEALDTVNKVGQEGRESRVYVRSGFTGTESATNPKYIIVGVDTFLGVVTNTWSAVMDPASHEIIPAGASVDVYYNDLSVGDGSDTSNLVYQTAGATAKSYKVSLTVEGSFSVGQIIGVNVATATGNVYTVGTDANIMNKTTYNASTDGTGASVEDSYGLRQVQVTVNSISYDSIPGATGSIVGFKDINGNQYYYSYTFCGPVLDGTAIGQTYNLWLDNSTMHNNVLYYERTNPGAGFGVITKAVVTQVNSGAYVVDYTILTPDNVEVAVRAGQPTNGMAFANQLAAENYANGNGSDAAAKFGDLVYYEGTNNYSKLTSTQIDTTGGKTAGDAPANGFGNSLYNYAELKFESGRAGAIGQTYANNDTPVKNEFVVGNGAYQTLVDDATIFFVAINNLDNTTGGRYNYKFDHYEIYRGFKTLPDLTVANPGNDTLDVTVGGVNAGAVINNLSIQAFDVAGNAIADWDTDSYAKYVVINNATSRTVPPASIPTVDYAFIIANDQLTDMTATYYNFPAFVNGTATTLQVAISAGRDVLQNGIGLYTYSNNVNGQGYSVVNLMDGSAGAGCNGNAASGLAAPYTGSFKLTDVTYSNSVITASNDGGTNYQHYTVADNCAAWLVNPTHGRLATSPLSLGAVQLYSHDGDATVWYQLNEFGQICLLYVVDVNMTGVFS